MPIEANTVYEVVSTKQRIRVLETYPIENIAIVIRMGVRLDRPRPAELSGLTDKLSFSGIVPVYGQSLNPDEFLSDHQIAHRDKMMGVIQPIVDLDLFELATGDFWKHITDAAKAADLSPNCVYGTLTRYFQGGCCKAAITPRWKDRGRHRSDEGNKTADYRPTKQPGCFGLTPSDIQKIKKGADHFYKGDATWPSAYNLFLKEFYLSHIEIDNQGREVKRALPADKCPSDWQFYRIGRRHLKTIGRLVAKLGQRGFELTGRGKPGSQAARGLYPGWTAEIDWTLTDVVAVRRRDRTSIGRLAVYAIVDRFSGMILSVYLTMSTGSWEEAARAILTCMEDKREVCARANYRLPKPEDWAVAHSFRLLISDKGEVDSWKSTPIGTGLGIKIKHTIRKRPDGKGTIEAVMKVINYMLYRRLPGATTGIRRRCEDDPRVTAEYDFDQLNELLHAFVVYWNKRIRRRQPMTKGMFDDGVIPAPNHIWKWGADNGCLRAPNLANARLQLLPWQTASVTEHGFVLQGLRYLIPDIDPGSPQGIEANEWLAKARQERWEIPLGIDLSTVSFVWLRHAARGRAPIMTQCPLAPGQDGYAHLSWEEWRLHRQSLKITLDAYKKGELRAAEENFAAVAARLAEEAAAKTGAARQGLSKADQKSNVGANRDHEKREHGATALSTGQAAKTTNVVRAYFDKDSWPQDHEVQTQQPA